IEFSKSMFEDVLADRREQPKLENLSEENRARLLEAISNTTEQEEGDRRSRALETLFDKALKELGVKSRGSLLRVPSQRIGGLLRSAENRGEFEVFHSGWFSRGLYRIRVPLPGSGTINFWVVDLGKGWFTGNRYQIIGSDDGAVSFSKVKEAFREES